MELLDEDNIKINLLYKCILNSLKEEFKIKSINDLKGTISYINSFYDKLIEQKNSVEPKLYNLSSYGVLSLCGYQICRNTNMLLYDILKKLNFNPSIQYIFVDNNNDWYKVKKIKSCCYMCKL